MLTCQAWFDFCAPALYRKLSLWRYRRTRVNLPIEKYGIDVQHLHLELTEVQEILHLVENKHRLGQLALSSKLTNPELYRVLSSVSGELAHLKIEQFPQPNIDWRQGMTWFPEPMFQSVAHLHNLRSLQ